jgi:hypothetical protein
MDTSPSRHHDGSGQHEHQSLVDELFLLAFPRAHATFYNDEYLEPRPEALEASRLLDEMNVLLCMLRDIHVAQEHEHGTVRRVYQKTLLRYLRVRQERQEIILPAARHGAPHQLAGAEPQWQRLLLAYRRIRNELRQDALVQAALALSAPNTDAAASSRRRRRRHSSRSVPKRHKSSDDLNHVEQMDVPETASNPPLLAMPTLFSALSRERRINTGAERIVAQSTMVAHYNIFPF